MKNQKTKPRSFWEAHVAQQEQSGLSQAAYCRQEGLHPTTFGGWRTRLKKQATAGALRFVPLEPCAVLDPEPEDSKTSPSAGVIRLFFNDCLLELPSQVAPEQLQVILTTLGRGGRHVAR